MPGILSVEHKEVRRILRDFSRRVTRYMPWIDTGLSQDEKERRLVDEILQTGEQLRGLGFLKDEPAELKRADATLPQEYYDVLRRREEGHLDNWTVCQLLRKVIVKQAFRLHSRHFKGVEKDYSPNTKMKKALKILRAFRAEPQASDLSEHRKRLEKLEGDIKNCGFNSLEEFISLRRDLSLE